MTTEEMVAAVKKLVSAIDKDETLIKQEAEKVSGSLCPYGSHIVATDIKLMMAKNLDDYGVLDHIDVECTNNRFGLICDRCKIDFANKRTMAVVKAIKELSGSQNMW